MESWGALAHFGHELRAYRERVGLTQAQLGEKVGYGDGLISKIERAERVPQTELCTALDDLFGTPGSFARLGQEVRQYAHLTRQFAEYIDRESSATAIHSYASHLVPGLLQTEDYARAIIGAARPRRTATEIDSRVAVRMTRQDAIARSHPRLWTIVDESVLYRQVGTVRVMAEQLRRMLSLRPYEVLQVYPYSAGPSPAQGDTFLVAEFANEPDIAHVDTTAGLRVPNDPDTANGYRVIFDHLRALALPEDRSQEMIATRLEGLST